MSCRRIVPDETKCCDTRLLPTKLEGYSADYYDCLRKTLQQLICDMYAAEAFGDPVKAKIMANLINDFHYLYGYMVILFLQRQEDAKNDLNCHMDKGNAFYWQEFQLECIRKYFQCKGVDISSLYNSFDLYPKTTLGPDGINFMSIEQAVPPTPQCNLDDQVFIVSKPIN